MSGNRYDARMLSPAAKEALRRRVVHAVVEQGMRPAQAVRVFRVSRTAVHGWVKAYGAGGARALRAHPLGRPKRSRLAGHQAATVVKLISHPALSGSTAVAVRVVDAAGSVLIAGQGLRPARVGVDGGTVSAALGPDAAETRATRLRAQPRRGRALAERGLPRDSRKSQAGTGRNSLGR